MHQTSYATLLALRSKLPPPSTESGLNIKLMHERNYLVLLFFSNHIILSSVRVGKFLAFCLGS